MKNNLLFGTLLLGMLFLMNCNPKNPNETDGDVANAEETSTLFEQITPEQSGINFINSIEETDSANVLIYGYFYNGAGVATGDLNNDGLLDLFFASNQGSSALYMNQGGMKFLDVSNKAGISTTGWCTGVTFADVDDDGWLDIYIVRSSPLESYDDRKNLLYRNNADGTFTEMAEEMGIADPGYGSTANFFDCDNDGDLDLFLANHPTDFGLDIRETQAHTKGDEFSTDRFYINDGKGKFSDQSKSAGVESYAFSLSCAASDFNNDGLTDLYVCNDFYFPDFLYINQGDGTFVDKHEDFFKHSSTNSRGSDIADINNDGRLDLMVLDILPYENYRRKLLLGPANFDYYLMRWQYGYGHQYMKNTLQIGTQNGMFQDVANYAGVSATDWSWTPLLADFDNDGYRDIYVTNGNLRDLTDQDFINYQDQFRNQNKRRMTVKEMAQALPTNKLKNLAFRNSGNLNFEPISREWGLGQAMVSNASIYADLDRDGDLDIITCNLNAPIAIYKNQTEENASITIQFKGSESNIHGIGCSVEIETSEGIQVADNYPSKGYLSSRAPEVHFGLAQSQVNRVKVKWPSGIINEMQGPFEKITVVEEAKGKKETKLETKEEQQLFTERTGLGIDFNHLESGYLDFQREPTLPFMYSKLGPSTAVGDLDGDGDDDIIFGSSVGADLRFYFQENGKFKSKPNTLNPKLDERIETGQILLFDCDGDKDLDLYICAGGNEYDNPNTKFYTDKLYINDGRGAFSESENGLPGNIKVPNSVVAPHDIDGDGDLDLFVGPTYLPGQYPSAFYAIVLENVDGKFIDAGPKWLPETMELGAVHSAQFCDLNGDGGKELVIASHWESIQVWSFNGARFVERTEEFGFGSQLGLWNGLVCEDFDNDGDIDIVASNWGLNSQFQASKLAPIFIDFGDLSKSGKSQAIVSQYFGNVLAPIYSMRELQKEFRFFVQQNFTKNYEYALSNRDDILGRISGGFKTRQLNNLAHVYFENTNGKFSPKQLPYQSQLGPIFGMDAIDVNGDGLKDLLLVGNSYDTKIEFGWEDALNGLVLLNEGKGAFKAVENSGFYTPHNAKSLARIRVGEELVYVVGNNHEKVQTFSLGLIQDWTQENTKICNGYFSQHSKWNIKKREAN